MTPVNHLRAIEASRPLYTVPSDNLVSEVLIPAMSSSTSVDCMAGYFSSGSFRYIAPGLAEFINQSSGTFRLLVSPNLDASDQEALRSGSEERKEVLERAALTILEGALLTESALERHTLDCLSYLIAAGRLELRFVLMKDGALFHPKVWIFHDRSDVLVAHGSSNVTVSGLLFNFETVSVERSWRGDDAATRAEQFQQIFERLWTGRDQDTLTIDLPRGLDLLARVPSGVPTLEDFWQAWDEDARQGLIAPRVGETAMGSDLALGQGAKLSIPRGLEWREGPFAHQGDAVAAWEGAGGRGLLAMATGSGKTATSLICATRLQEEEPRLLVIIAAPYRPLVAQWSDEVESFGIKPLRLTEQSSTERTRAIAGALRRLGSGLSSVEVAVITHDYLVSDALHRLLQDIPTSIATLLVADEVHNLGRPRFVTRPPTQFKYRIGLSATPVLQYNAIGTQALSDFFGDTVFEFSLGQAIGVCLVPYEYYIHPVPLGGDERTQWERLTNRLLRAGFAGHDDGEEGGLSSEVLALLVKRRAVLEGAASKVAELRAILCEQGPEHVRHTLVYCSDKRPRQLIAVNQELLQLGMFVRQITAEETTDRRKTAEILEDFARGDYQVITCKRVLDEGVDLPQVRQAFLLASSTVRRQWVQRRGRILRRCDAIGKQMAYLHDFVVIPDDPQSPSGRSILRQELDRVRAFAELASNAGSPDGPFARMRGLV